MKLNALPKTDESFLDKLKELQKTFRQHARDEKTEILPAVQRALSEEQVQTVTEKMEAGRAEAEQARQHKPRNGGRRPGRSASRRSSRPNRPRPPSGTAGRPSSRPGRPLARWPMPP